MDLTGNAAACWRFVVSRMREHTAAPRADVERERSSRIGFRLWRLIVVRQTFDETLYDRIHINERELEIIALGARVHFCVTETVIASFAQPFAGR